MRTENFVVLVFLMTVVIHGVKSQNIIETLDEVKERLRDQFPRMQDDLKEAQEDIATGQKNLDDHILEFEAHIQKANEFFEYCPDIRDEEGMPPHHSKQLGNARTEGFHVTFTCDEGYIEREEGIKAKCSSARTWTVSGSSNCVLPSIYENPKLNDEQVFPCTPVGTLLTLEITPLKKDTFIIDIEDKDGNIILHNSIRMYWGTYVVNRKINGWWQWESYPVFDFQVGKTFTIKFLLVEGGIEVYVDDEFRFDYDDQGRKAYAWRVNGAATFHSGTFSVLNNEC